MTACFRTNWFRVRRTAFIFQATGLIWDCMRSARPYASVLERLREAGLRPTRQRLALARLLLEKGDRHVSAEQLHSEALDASIRVSLATVYNTLHQFTDAGLLREVVVEPGRSYFDTNVDDHHHFFFEGSGELQDIPGDRIVVAGLPAPPQGTIRRVDVIVRVQDGGKDGSGRA
jgi:Fur family transcriptional regulator, iron response regulator